MSPPDTNVEKQKEQHKPALLGIGSVTVFAGILLIGLITWLAFKGQEPVNPETRIDGRTGQEVQAE